MTTDPQAVAEREAIRSAAIVLKANGLNPYQRAAVLNLSAEWTVAHVQELRIEELRACGLIEGSPTKIRRQHKFRLTPLGLAVREHLERGR